MIIQKIGRDHAHPCKRAVTVAAAVLSVSLLLPFNIFSKSFADHAFYLPELPELPDSIALSTPVEPAETVVTVDSINASGTRLTVVPIDTLAVTDRQELSRVFNPEPSRAIWLSALFPGLGQVYNRRYWKLPIVVGAFMGLGYGTSWNNSMLREYTTAYNDIMDNDPTTHSYMDFFPSSVKEEDLDKTWLTSTLRSRKDYFRRNRDLCIICMVGVYLIAMVDAYVDASLAHFDISPDLSMQVAPALIHDSRSSFPGVGIQWAFNF